ANLDFGISQTEFQDSSLKGSERYLELYKINNPLKSKLSVIIIPDSLSEELDNTEDFHSILSNEPIFQELIQYVPDIKKGDAIDTADYRGVGIWYFDGNKFVKTGGEYGYFLPAEAWKMVEKYGLDFFEDIPVEFVTIPANATLEVDGERVIPKNIGIYIRPDDLDDDQIKELEINGKTYPN